MIKYADVKNFKDYEVNLEFHFLFVKLLLPY